MILFIDTETTGVNPQRDRLVQLAWIVATENGEVIGKSSMVVRPEGFVIPQGATRIHGITTEMAIRSGVPLKHSLQQLVTSGANASLLVAHNITYDVGILKGEFHRAGLAYPFDATPHICTMKATTNFCRLPKLGGNQGFKYPKLDELYRHLFGYDFLNGHTADADTEACMKCFFELVTRKVISIPPTIETPINASQENHVTSSRLDNDNNAQPEPSPFLSEGSFSSSDRAYASRKVRCESQQESARDRAFTRAFTFKTAHQKSKQCSGESCMDALSELSASTPNPSITESGNNETPCLVTHDNGASSPVPTPLVPKAQLRNNSKYQMKRIRTIDLLRSLETLDEDEILEMWEGFLYWTSGNELEDDDEVTYFLPNLTDEFEYLSGEFQGIVSALHIYGRRATVIENTKIDNALSQQFSTLKWAVEPAVLFDWAYYVFLARRSSMSLALKILSQAKTTKEMLFAGKVCYLTGQREKALRILESYIPACEREVDPRFHFFLRQRPVIESLGILTELLLHENATRKRPLPNFYIKAVNAYMPQWIPSFSKPEKRESHGLILDTLVTAVEFANDGKDFNCECFQKNLNQWMSPWDEFDSDYAPTHDPKDGYDLLPNDMITAQVVMLRAMQRQSEAAPLGS